jgi:menaquinol-cytochrome c reductase iron-sulfur subunit
MDDLNIRRDARKPRTSRRGFVRLASTIISAIVGLLLGIPFMAALIAPTYRKSQSPYARVGDVDSLPRDKPVNLRFRLQGMDAFIRQTVTHEVWVVKHSDHELTVFSPICTHLGCHYDWIASAQEFVCPCHGSIFALTGKVLAGPAPRPLDTLPYRIDNGVLYVKWERFQAGIPEKIRV